MTRDSAPALLLWDVDHTLIENGGVSKENYALAFTLLTGREPEIQPSTDGRTDITIMASLLESNGVANSIPLDEQFAALIELESGIRVDSPTEDMQCPGLSTA